jgi:hypothetical protein
VSTFTTCITNFSRLDRLKECVASLELDKHPHPVAIASFGASPYHSKFLATLPECVTSFTSRKDFGCNQLWIKTLELAKTKWVSILHDDDRRPANFAATVEALIDKAEALGCGFIAWNGLQLDIKTGKTGGVITIAAGTDGAHDSASLLPMLRAKDSLPNSPVSFLFDRQTALDALYWAEENLKDCTTRPTMMIGNDVALVVAHVQRYSKFLQSSKPLSLYGHWDGSETVAWTKGVNDQLLPAYNRARERLARSKIPPRVMEMAEEVAPKPKAEPKAEAPVPDTTVLVWSDTLGEPLSADTQRRNALARSTWEPLLQSRPGWVEHHVTEVPRTSRDFGDTRTLPFIHDMVEQAVAKTRKPTDVVILINADICLTPWGADAVERAVKQYGACHCTRLNFPRPMQVVKHRSQLTGGIWFAGTDMVAFTAKWWTEHKAEFPDMVLACECWDLVMRNLINITGGVDVPDAIYHEIHDNYWYDGARSRPREFPGNAHNQRLSKIFFDANKSRGADPDDWRKEIRRREAQAKQSVKFLPLHLRIVRMPSAK